MIGRVATLVARTQLTRGRLIAMLCIGGLAVLLGLAIGKGDSARQISDTLDMTDGYGLGLLAPVVALTLTARVSFPSPGDHREKPSPAFDRDCDSLHPCAPLQLTD